MKEYQERIDVRAERWVPGRSVEGVEEQRNPGNPVEVVGRVNTPAGMVTVQPGDWVVTDSQGRREVHSPDEFDRQFERPDQMLERLTNASMRGQMMRRR